MELTFVIGGNVRKVFINGRVISILTKETGFVPIEIDLDNLDILNETIKSKVDEEQLNLLEEISHLKTEEEMAKDIIKDFQSSGWRLIKKEK